MKNLLKYNTYVRSLENKAKGGLSFYYINHHVYIIDLYNRLLGIWDIKIGSPIDWKYQHISR